MRSILRVRVHLARRQMYDTPRVVYLSAGILTSFTS